MVRILLGIADFCFSGEFPSPFFGNRKRPRCHSAVSYRYGRKPLSASFAHHINSLRIAGISTVIIFFLGIFAAYYIAKAPRLVKGILDVVLTLPLVLPPTVVGYLLLRVLGPKRVIGAWVLEHFGVKLTMTWWSAIFATTVVIFPLMYRTARGAFESFDETLAYAGQTLGLSNTTIFWRIRTPARSACISRTTAWCAARRRPWCARARRTRSPSPA